MIVEHGIMDSRYIATASLDAAVAQAARSETVAWVGALDPSPTDIEEIARSFGLGDRASIEFAQRPGPSRVPRTRIARLERGVHLVMPGLRIDDTGGARLMGSLDLLATPDGVAVLASELPDSMHPAAIRERLETSLAQTDTPSGGLVLGLVVSQMLEWYEDLLDELEEEAVRVADDVFVTRRGDQLKRISALSRPVHTAAAGVQPLLGALDELGWSPGLPLDVSLAKRLQSEVLHLSGRLQRIDALLSTAQQSYFNLAQDDANSLMEQQGDATRKMSGYALLVAIPTIIFSLYGTNFHHVPLIHKSWGYGVMLGITLILCLITWWRLRKSGWI